MIKEELDTILNKHLKWLRNEGGGERADLRDADLSGMDLRYVNLRDANLSRSYLIGANLRYSDLIGANLMYSDLRDADLRDTDLSCANLRYSDLRDTDLRDTDLSCAMLPVTDSVLLSPWGLCHVQREHIRIGCQYRTTEEWRGFSDDEIIDMANGALKWWKQWKPVVMAMAEACEPYGENK